MNLYCPVCLGSSLNIKQRGKAFVEVNGKRMDANAFLYHLDKEPKELFFKNLHKKVEEYFSWFASFQNSVVIKQVEITTSDIICDSKCSFAPSMRISLINVVISAAEVLAMLQVLGKKYQMTIDLEKK